MTVSHEPAPRNRWLFHAAWMSSAALFMTVGWTAMRPWDPQASLSLLAHSKPISMMIAVMALAAVVSGIATVLAGRIHADVGTFAVGLGLTVASLRGGNMSYLLIENEGRSGLCFRLMGESLFWFATMVVAMAAGAFVLRWFRHENPIPDGGTSADSAMGRGALAALVDLRSDRVEVALGVKHVAMTALVALVLIRLFSAGGDERVVRHGQACFAVAASFYLAAGRAQLKFPVRSTGWTCVAVPVVSLLAYGIAWGFSLKPSPLGQLAPIPPSNFLRALPVTYVALGVAAALLGHWRADAAHAVDAQTR